MILHLVRHPKPIVPAGTCYGRLDVPAEGVEADAGRLRNLLPAGLPVWTSPLVRCRRLAECLHPAPRVEARLAEMHFGDWEGRTWDEIGAAALDAWAADVAGFTPPGGESALDLQARVLAGIGGILEEAGNGEAILVTHAGVMRMLVAHWQGLPPGEWLRLAFGYGMVTTVAVDTGKATVLELNR